MIDAKAQEDAYCFLFKTQSASLASHCQHLEELTISIAMDNTELLVTNVYIPLTSSCNGRYSPPIDHLLTDTNSRS